MTTYTDFQPVPRAPFRFSPVLDGATYAGVVAWSVFGQRWRLTVYGLEGDRVVSVPLVGSPDLVATTAVVWDSARGAVTVTTAAAHGVAVGSVVEWVLRGVAPAGFNGTYLMRATGATTLVFDQMGSPGAVIATVQGRVGCDVDLTAGYFSVSTLVFRESSQQFEVSP